MCVRVCEVPHTSSVKVCHNCMGAGVNRCWRCMGRGRVSVCVYVAHAVTLPSRWFVATVMARAESYVLWSTTTITMDTVIMDMVTMDMVTMDTVTMDTVTMTCIRMWSVFSVTTVTGLEGRGTLKSHPRVVRLQY